VIIENTMDGMGKVFEEAHETFHRPVRRLAFPSPPGRWMQDFARHSKERRCFRVLFYRTLPYSFGLLVQVGRWGFQL